MTNLELVPPLTEDSIKEALILARGDLFTASQHLGHVSVVRLDRAIRVSEELQRLFLALREIRATPEYEKLSQDQVMLDISRRLTLYRSDGLDSLHELATMPIGDNSAMAQVKLAAAARLAGGVESDQGGSDVAQTLALLNQAYHEHAPRIKSVRERVIEFHQPSSTSAPSLPAE